MNARIPLLAALAVSLFSWKASAQAWVNNRYYDGPGVRAGNFELHWSAGAEFGYDSNYFRTAGDGRPGEEVVDVFLLRVTPSLRLTTLGEERRGGVDPKVKFSAGAYVSYHEVIAADSANSDVSEQRNAGVGADARLEMFPKGKVGFDALAAYVRTIDTDGSSDDLAGDGFNRDTVRGGAGLTWRPGGGLFEWRTGYNVTYNYIEDSDFDYLTNLHHQIHTRGRWKFLPRSALLFDGSYNFVRYVQDSSPQNDGDNVHARIGFHGLVTYHLALLGMLGWASSFYENTASTISARQYDSFTVNAEARWFIMPRPNLEETTAVTGLSSIAAGYNRSFNNSYQGSFYQRDRVYAQFNMFLLGALYGGIELGASRIGYPEVDANPGANVLPSPAITQMRFDGRLFAEYRITDMFATNASFLYDKLTSDPTIVNQENLEYDRWQVFIGARLFM